MVPCESEEEGQGNGLNRLESLGPNQCTTSNIKRSFTGDFHLQFLSECLDYSFGYLESVLV